MTSVIGHADRAVPLRDYCVGLLAAQGRKSLEPMAAVIGLKHPSRAGARGLWITTRAAVPRLEACVSPTARTATAPAGGGRR